ncbi:MAG: hypothetical protein COB12_10455 [Flavobacterium sp.]|nr:MAG: hypothetical protein COB12_10455 [Flavobacterium sp.]
MKNSYLLLSFLIIAFSVNSQNIVVYDSINNQALPYVAVLYGETGIYSDENGVFNLTEITTDSLTIKFFGYERIEVATKNLKDTLFINPSPQELAQVVIKNKYKEIIVKQPKKSRSLGSCIAAKEMEIILIAKPKKELINTLIKELSIKINKLIKFDLPDDFNKKEVLANIRINIYTVRDSLPIQKIYSSIPKIINVLNDNVVIINIKDEFIKLPKEGLGFSIEFIGFRNPNNLLILDYKFIRPGLTKTRIFGELLDVKTYLSYPLNNKMEYISIEEFNKQNWPGNTKNFGKNLIIGFVFLK